MCINGKKNILETGDVLDKKCTIVLDSEYKQMALQESTRRIGFLYDVSRQTIVNYVCKDNLIFKHPKTIPSFISKNLD